MAELLKTHFTYSAIRLGYCQKNLYISFMKVLVGLAIAIAVGVAIAKATKPKTANQ